MMKKYLIQFLIILLIIPLNNCFNVDVNNPMIYIDPYPKSVNKTSYFGYSLILYPGSKIDHPWIRIGAPRGSGKKSKFKDPGVVFQCNIGDVCQMLEFDTDGENIFSSTSGYKYRKKLDDAWIGGTMDINYKHRRVVTCGFRRINERLSVKDYMIQGSCYWSHLNDNSTIKLLPLFVSEKEIHRDRISNVTAYNYGQGQAGFSIHMPLQENQLILGAPGVYNWQGTSILYEDGINDSPIASRFNRLNKRQSDINLGEFEHVNIANAITTTQTRVFNLMGYSQTSGYFFKSDELLYVGGSPKSDKYLGKVLLYTFNKSVDQPIIVKDLKLGLQFGEYFGASLTSGDINNDGYDDLIVGAPFYVDKKFNEGRVHVFLGSSTGKLQIPLQGARISGNVINGQFGLNLQFVGDIDHDGFGDVIVAAPYEEIGGVVYLFKGSSKGLNPSPSQRIIGTTIDINIRGFGIGISRSVDIDGNGYADMAIGAYESGHAVLLRSSPTIAIHHRLKSLVPKIETKKTTITVEACLGYKLDVSNEAVYIEREMIVDEALGRALNTFNNDIKKFTSPIDQCENFTITLKGNFNNYNDPITVTLKHSFKAQTVDQEKILIFNETEGVQGMDKFCVRCPIYDKYLSTSPTTISIPFTLGCGEDNVCDTILEFEPNFINLIGDTFVVGSKDFLQLQTKIRNVGEKAYLTKLVVHLPEIINFRQIPTFCDATNTTSISCLVENILQENSQKTVILDLDMANVNNGESPEFLTITIIILTSSNNSNENKKILNLKLTRDVDITVTGKSDEQSYSISNLTMGQPNFTQTYQIQKFGISPIDEVILEIDVPHSLILNSKETINFLNVYPPVGFLEGQPINCRSDFNYIFESRNEQSSIFNEDDNNSNNTRLKRSVKTEESEIFTEEIDLSVNKEMLEMESDSFNQFSNRTFSLNCSNSQCSKIICVSGPFKSAQIIGVVDVKMQLNVSAIQDVIKDKVIVFFTTKASVFIVRPASLIQNGTKPDWVQVSSVFIREVVRPQIETWIIIVSIIAGLLLLLFLILGLVKAGFFKRAKKEELEQLKQEMENEEDFNPDVAME